MSEDNLVRYVSYEPTDDSMVHTCYPLTKEKAIEFQNKSCMQSRGHFYPSDEQALDDYIVVNWVQIIQIPKDFYKMTELKKKLKRLSVLMILMVMATVRNVAGH